MYPRMQVWWVFLEASSLLICLHLAAHILNWKHFILSKFDPLTLCWAFNDYFVSPSEIVGDMGSNPS